ncbi:MAG: transposase [Deltaproteobacteria bacterium]|nr:transposase [Deltaproteobacteria bacterium]
MKKRKIYTGSFKFNVVVELLKGKKTLVELAQEYGLHPNQIKNWKSVFMKRGSEILEDRRKKKDIETKH